MKTASRWPNPGARYVALVVALLLIDQAIKLAAHAWLAPYQSVSSLGPLAVTFELHEGTALGRLLPEELDRYLRIGSHVALAIGLFLLLAFWRRRDGSRLLLLGLAVCLAGQLGNLVDRVIHGVLLDDALPGHLTRWFHGQVTDTFRLTFFPVRVPDWFPRGGGRLLFPRMAFNLADVMVALGGILALVGLTRQVRREVPP